MPMTWPIAQEGGQIEQGLQGPSFIFRPYNSLEKVWSTEIFGQSFESPQYIQQIEV